MPRCATPIPAGRLTSPLRPAHGRSSTGTGAPERGAMCFAPAKSHSVVRGGCAGHFRPGTCANPTPTTRSNNIALTDHDAAMLRRRRLHYPRTTSRPSAYLDEVLHLCDYRWVEARDSLRAYLFAKRLDELGSCLRRTSYRDLDAARAVAREPGRSYSSPLGPSLVDSASDWS